MKIKKILISFFVSLFMLERVSAHCPLCTIGAGAAAGAAVWLGVSKVVVAMFIGAFAMSMGMWFSRIVKKQYVPFQKSLIVILVFLTTVLPLLPIFKAIGPLYLSFIGAYGTTYAFDYSLASSFLGGVIVFISPNLSGQVTKLRKGKMLPFQGTALTLLSLIIVGFVIQFLV